MSEENRVILFVFAGRRKNMELQIPFAKKIIEENSDVDYHVWNLSRDRYDSEYLQTITGERITVFNDYQECSPGYDEVFKHYADKKFQKNIFVKLDDDIVFIETKKFRGFIDSIKSNPEKVLSANVINNGACTPIEKELWQKFTRLAIPLLDVHKSSSYAYEAHKYFFQNYQEMLKHEIRLIPTQDWLSINTIGYNWEIGKNISELVGKSLEKRTIVAGRELSSLGDEGAVNTLPRTIVKGFVAAHLTFGPQKLTESQLDPVRKAYSLISKNYLEEDREALTELQDMLQSTSFSSVNWRSRWAESEKDPTAGFYRP